jgi:hypothetical protein
MPEGYRVLEVTTPVGTLRKRTAQQVAVVSVYRATRTMRVARVMVKDGDLFAVWHRTHRAAADAPRLLFAAELIGQWFIEERQWAARA